MTTASPYQRINTINTPRGDSEMTRSLQDFGALFGVDCALQRFDWSRGITRTWRRQHSNNTQECDSYYPRQCRPWCPLHWYKSLKRHDPIETLISKADLNSTGRSCHRKRGDVDMENELKPQKWVIYDCWDVSWLFYRWKQLKEI